MITSISCQTESNAIDNSSNSVKINKMNWSERNYQILNQFIFDYGKGGKYYNTNQKPYCVIDWDNTSAYLDVEEALMRYQLVNLNIKLTKEQFKSILKDEINGVTKFNTDFKNIPLVDINTDLIDSYNRIYDMYEGLNGNLTLSQVKQNPYYLEFIAKIAYLYDAYCSTDGIGADYGYPWVLNLLAGYTIDEVKTMAKDAIRYELGNKLSKEEWITPSQMNSKIGVIKYSYKTGLRVLPEMQNLLTAFESNGIDVFIVSASFKPVVEAFSEMNAFGYNIPNDRVIAMELNTKNGIIQPEYKDNWVKTVGAGKVEAINRAIKSELNRNWDPIFSAADSDGDYEMSTMFPDMKLTLIWNRLKGGPIGNLCKQAVNEIEMQSPRFILQGRNENSGTAIPFSETILYGKTEMKLLP